jgi:hypothetical protein
MVESPSILSLREAQGKENASSPLGVEKEV